MSLSICQRQRQRERRRLEVQSRLLPIRWPTASTQRVSSTSNRAHLPDICLRNYPPYQSVLPESALAGSCCSNSTVTPCSGPVPCRMRRLDTFSNRMWCAALAECRVTTFCQDTRDGVGKYSRTWTHLRVALNSSSGIVTYHIACLKSRAPLTSLSRRQTPFLWSRGLHAGMCESRSGAGKAEG